jgi:hypothetical protein
MTPELVLRQSGKRLEPRERYVSADDRRRLKYGLLLWCEPINARRQDSFDGPGASMVLTGRTSL